MRLGAQWLRGTGAGRSYFWVLVGVMAIPFRWWWMAGLGAISLWSFGRLRSRRRPAATEDVIRFGRLLVIPLTGGLSLSNSLMMVSREAHPQLRIEVSQALRQGRQIGLARALAASGGHLGELFGRMAGAQASGSSVVRAVTTHVDNLHYQTRMEALSRIRSLPVTLAVPLTLLIVPGFLLALVGPPVATRVAEMLTGLIGT
ncbi:MAG: type II secretion system F family protein [Actinomycetia bacterium]|nr:type II secretion system F family protein [Actinomycetes bacterium]